LNIGVFLVEGLVEGREPVLLVRFVTCGTASEPIFIADLDVFDGPRLRVAKRGTDSPPFRGLGITREELDLIEGVLNCPADLGFREEVTVKGEASPDANDCKELAAVLFGTKSGDILGSKFISSHHSMYSIIPSPFVIW
jgi:hypothetical protein